MTFGKFWQNVSAFDDVKIYAVTYGGLEEIFSGIKAELPRGHFAVLRNVKLTGVFNDGQLITVIVSDAERNSFVPKRLLSLVQKTQKEIVRALRKKTHSW